METELRSGDSSDDHHHIRAFQHLDTVFQQVDISADHPSLGHLQMPSLPVPHYVPLDHGIDRTGWHLALCLPLVPDQSCDQNTGMSESTASELVPIHTR